MERVTANLTRNTFLGNVGRQQSEIEKVEQQIASQRKIGSAHEDPVATGEIMFQKSRGKEIERYQRNIDFSKARLDLTESKIQELNTLMQRARELAVQGANGIYTQEDRQKMAAEVNQLLEQAVQIANEKYKGESLFSGTKTQEEAFKISTGKIVDPVTGEVKWGEESIKKVEYQGDIGRRYAEVGRGEYIAVNLTGNDLFAASNQMIVSGTPGTGYIAQTDQTIRIDQAEIQIKAGDNLRTVADKINSAHLNVKAEIDNTTGRNLMILKTTTPHQMWLEDLNGGSVLQDLGLVSSAVAAPPYNYASSAAVHGESVFDKLISLRDSLYSGDSEGINASLGGMDQSLNSLQHHMATVGAVQNRMENTEARLSVQKLYSTEMMNRLNGLDMAEAVTRLKNLEMEYNAALQIGAKLLPKTLLDYLR